MPLPHNLFDYCSIRKSNFIEKYLVVKRKISFVYKADILLTKLIIRGEGFMLLNDEKYKLIDIDSLDFSVRLRNVAHRNGIRTLYDLVESYNSGEFEKMRNVGANTVQELLDFDLVSAEPSVEEVIPGVGYEKVLYENISTRNLRLGFRLWIRCRGLWH